MLAGLADIASQLTDGAAGLNRLPGRLTDCADRGIRRLEQAFQDLGVAIDRGQRPIEDAVEVFQPDLEQRLRIDVLDVQFDLTDVHVDARDDLHEIGQSRLQRKMRVQVFDVQVDLADVQVRHVQEDVRFVARRAALGAWPVASILRAVPRR